MDALNYRGIRPATMLAGAGLSWSEVSDDRRLVDFSVFRRLVTYATQRSGDPLLGLLAGSMLQPYHSPVGIGVMTSDCLQESLKFFCRHSTLIFPGLAFDLGVEGRMGSLRARSLRPLLDTQNFLVYSAVSINSRLLEAILGRVVDELVIEMPSPRLADSACDILSYGRSFHFDREQLSFHFPRELLSAPCASADSAAHAAAALTCERISSERNQGAFVQRVRDALRERLSENPAIDDVALHLGVSSATFLRRLARSGVAFSDIKEEIRRSDAAWYLKHTELSIEAIAAQLGYSDPTNFGRKFKYWYQIPPSKMRQALRTDE